MNLAGGSSEGFPGDSTLGLTVLHHTSDTSIPKTRAEDPVRTRILVRVLTKAR
jgi:hypothetical protein